MFDVWHDLGRILCFVGETMSNRRYYEWYRHLRPTEIITFEEAQIKSQDWFDQRQFMCSVTDVGFKKSVVDGLSTFNPHWFSLVSKHASLGNNVKIGYGTSVNDFNFVWDNVTIGDHVIVTNHAVLSHGTAIGDYCFITPYCYFCFTTLGQGVVVGLRSSFVPKPTSPIHVADWTNFLMDSKVNNSIIEAGTYQGHRLKSSITSLDQKIL